MEVGVEEVEEEEEVVGATEEAVGLAQPLGVSEPQGNRVRRVGSNLQTQGYTDD
jgi:hypothetical protein